MKKYVMLSLVAILATSCNAQEKKDQALVQEKENGPAKDSPAGSWKVEKEMDENGNIIRYDSIYSWSSSGRHQNLGQQDLDSLLQSFGSFSHQGFPSMDGFDFPNSLRNDSLFLKGFFDDDFFQNGFNSHFPDMESFQQQLDSVQKYFFDRHPSIIVPQMNDSIGRRAKI